jgi:hypothetical protein
MDQSGKPDIPIVVTKVICTEQHDLTGANFIRWHGYHFEGAV